MISKTQPLVPKNPERGLYVLIIGRVSTPQQRQESIDASQRFAEEHLRRIYEGKLHVINLGEQASGMVVDRETMVQAEEHIETGEVDLILAEDLSRIYRNPRLQYDFVQNCVDLDIRVICVGDNIDTAEENWEVAMGAASMRHGLTIPDTRRRVRRTATEAFYKGGMVQKIRAGYRKLTKEEAESGNFGQKGLRIAKDPEFTPIAKEMQRRILRGDTYSSIAEWLNGENVFPGPYSKHGRWTARMVIDLMRDPILSGKRQFRKVRHKMLYRTGKCRREKNATPETQICPELAHITPEEHEKLVAAMDCRSSTRCTKSGRNHPLSGKARSKTIWPGQHLVCAICGSLMYYYNERQLKCRNAHESGPQVCWNHVQVDTSIIRDRVLSLVLSELRMQPSVFSRFLDEVATNVDRLQKGSAESTSRLKSQIRELTRQSENIARAIGMGGDLQSLVERGTAIELELRTCKDELQRQEQAESTAEWPESRETLETRIDKVLRAVAVSSYEFGDLMRQLIPEFLIHPVQALDTPLVRPRGILKVETSLLLDECAEDQPHLEPVTAELDLFDPPQHIAHLDDCIQIKRKNPDYGYVKIGQALGIGRMTVRRAIKYFERMQSRGTPEPYRVLTERPTQASRWKLRA